jgi:hypothetical protein
MYSRVSDPRDQPLNLQTGYRRCSRERLPDGPKQNLDPGNVERLEPISLKGHEFCDKYCCLYVEHMASTLFANSINVSRHMVTLTAVPQYDCSVRDYFNHFKSKLV